MIARILNAYSVFMQRHRLLIGAAVILAFVNIFSLRTLTTRPALWYDEGINLELARNFAQFGELDLSLAPGVMSGLGANIGSTGYTVTVPLAVLFRLFGFGVVQARLYMLLWMNLCLVAVYYALHKRWGGHMALLATGLIATFAPFFGNGRSVMGEIPGFTLLVLALATVCEGRSVFVAGIFAGLAAVTKPSVYVFALPALVVVFLFERKDALKKSFQLFLGSVVALIPWAFLYRNTVVTLQLWTRLKAHFANPYASAGLTPLQNIKNNLASFFHSATLVYLLVLTVAIVLAVYIDREFYKKNRTLILFSALYSIGSFFYFLKSVGYLRYLIATQFLILILFVPALHAVSGKFFAPTAKRFFLGGMSALIAFQTSYLLTNAKLFYSERAVQAAAYIAAYAPSGTVGVINSPVIAALVPPERKYETLSTYGLVNLGPNPLSFPKEELPDVIVFDRSYTLEERYKPVIAKFYALAESIDDDVMIYRKLSSPR